MFTYDFACFIFIFISLLIDVVILVNILPGVLKILSYSKSRPLRLFLKFCTDPLRSNWVKTSFSYGFVISL